MFHGAMRLKCKHVTLHVLFSMDPNAPNVWSIADAAIMHGVKGSLGSPYLNLWRRPILGG